MAYFERGCQKEHRWLVPSAGDPDDGAEQITVPKQVVIQTRHAPLQSSGVSISTALLIGHVVQFLGLDENRPHGWQSNVRLCVWVSGV